MFLLILWIFVLIIWIVNLILRIRPHMKNVKGNNFQILIAALFIILAVVNIITIVVDKSAESETFLCRTQVWEDYYMYALLEIPQRLSNDLDDLNMKIYSGDSFEPCGFLSHPYLRFEFRNWKEDLRVEYKGKREYLPNPNTFVLLERKNLSYLNIKE